MTYLKTIIKIAISVFILFVLFYDTDFNKFILSLKNINITYFLFGFAIIYISLLLMTLKFNLFIKNVSNISLRQLFCVYWASDFLNLFSLGAIGSEAYKMISFKEKKKALAASLIDKAYSLLWCLVFVISFILVYLYPSDLNYVKIIVLSIIYLLIVSLLVASNNIIKNYFKKKFSSQRFPELLKLIYIDKSSLIKHSFYVFIYISVTCLIYTIILYGVAITPRLELLFVVPIIMVMTTLPISIQGLGIREYVLVQYAVILNLDSELILAGSLLIFFANIIYRLTGAIPFLFVKNIHN